MDGRRRPRIRRPAVHAARRSRRCARRRGEMQATGPEVGRDRRDLLAARSQPRAARGGDLVAEEIPDAAITCSSDLGRIGLLERENAACSTPRWPISRATRSRRSRRRSPIPASRRRCSSPRTTARWPRPSQARRLPVYSLRLGRHQFDARRRLPVRASPTPWSSMSAAPRPMSASSSAASRARPTRWSKVGGVRTLFRMPDLLSIGLGGGSHVALDPLDGRAGVGRLPPA